MASLRPSKRPRLANKMNRKSTQTDEVGWAELPAEAGELEELVHMGHKLEDKKRIKLLEANFSRLKDEKNQLLHFYFVSMLEKNMMTLPPTETEFADLSVCTQKYYSEKFPDRKFGEYKKPQYGSFLCGSLLPDGTTCPLKYGMMFQVDACRKWHNHQNEKNRQKVKKMLKQNFN